MREDVGCWMRWRGDEGARAVWRSDFKLGGWCFCSHLPPPTSPHIAGLGQVSIVNTNANRVCAHASVCHGLFVDITLHTNRICIIPRL